MPNTLAHIGIQSLIVRAGYPKADLKWVWAGCILPDLPWIVQRLARIVNPDISRLDVRLYAVVQSSLFITLIIAAALALLSRHPRRTFAILSVGVVLHLVLDAMQIKWGNGVVLFAPASWSLTNFALVWPEAWITIAVTLLGLIYTVYAIATERPTISRPVWRPWSRLIGVVFLCTAYAALPLVWMQTVERANLHDVATLRSASDRAGKSISVDRNTIVQDMTGTYQLQSWTGDRFTLLGDIPDGASEVSILGQFVDSQTIQVSELHVHPAGRRDLLSYFGLLIIAGWWLSLAWRKP